MGQNMTQVDGSTGLETACDSLRERFPNAEYVGVYESTQMLSIGFDLDDLPEDEDGLFMVDRYDIPTGYMFDAVSLHEETREMFVTLRPEES